MLPPALFDNPAGLAIKLGKFPDQPPQNFSRDAEIPTNKFLNGAGLTEMVNFPTIFCSSNKTMHFIKVLIKTTGSLTEPYL